MSGTSRFWLGVIGGMLFVFANERILKSPVPTPPTVAAQEPANKHAEDDEALRKLVYKLLNERRAKAVLSRRMVHLYVDGDSVLDLQKHCGEYLVLQSSAAITLNRSQFSREMSLQKDAVCETWITNGNLVAGRFITIPDTPDLLTEYGEDVVLAPMHKETIHVLGWAIAAAWVEAHWNEDGRP